jgi:hypothetical protein
VPSLAVEVASEVSRLNTARSADSAAILSAMFASNQSHTSVNIFSSTSASSRG